ncbi:Uncharacterised protein [Acinetobacter baumannii]|nr:Uncharacterised protein [Acinetobacter baumannii]
MRPDWLLIWSALTDKSFSACRVPEVLLTTPDPALIATMPWLLPIWPLLLSRPLEVRVTS